MSQDEEPSIIEYARFHNLISDHLAVDPLAAFSGNENLEVLEDDSDLPDPLGGSGSLPPERLTINREAFAFLSNVCKEPPMPPSFVIGDSSRSRYYQLRDAKVEMPLLSTDHDLDMQDFHRRHLPDLSNINLPFVETDDEQDEGINFPATSHGLASNFANKIGSEKLSVSKEALEYLQNAIKCPSIDHKFFDLEASRKRRERKSLTEPISSPLMPMSPEVVPFVPSSDAVRLELLSEHTSPFRNELHQLDQQILRNDAILPEISKQNNNGSDHGQKAFDFENIGEIYSPLKDIEKTPPLERMPRKRISDPETSSPLLPAVWEQAPSEVKISSVEEISGGVIPEKPSPIPYPEDTSPDDIDQFFLQASQASADKTDRLTKEKQRQEVATTQRVKVPDLDFSLPPTPWEIYSQVSESKEERMASFLRDIKQLNLHDVPWPASAKAERELQWAPFPSNLAQGPIDEIAFEDYLLAPWIAQPDPPDFKLFAWKRPGLRILDEDDSDDEEISRAEFPESSELVALMRKRKREIETAGKQTEGLTPEIGVQPINKSTTSQPDPDQNFISRFSVFAATDDFMSIRMGKIRKPVHGQDVASAREATAKDINPVIQDPPSTDLTKSDNAYPPLNTEALLPDQEQPTVPCTFIISSTIISQLKLVRTIRDLYPASNLIERDFSQHALSSATANKPPTSHDLIKLDPICHEADILLSPGVGLVLTTLQKLHQRPLPGSQITTPIFQTRLSLMAPRYTTLLVLVSHNQLPNAPFAPLGSSDCAAIVELIAFTHGPVFVSLDTEVQTVFVPGGESELARWVVGLMAKYGSTHRNFDPAEDETTWELWLRRAGMNSFAAQAVLAKLRPPEGSSPSLSELWGLPRFVAMGGQERLRRFAGLMGGEGVLRRVGNLLDARW